MKKLLFMVAAMLVMVSCGSKEKKELTPEQQAEQFAKECIDGIVAENRAAVEGVITDMTNYVESLDESVKETFMRTFTDRFDDLVEEFTKEQEDKAQAFLLGNLNVVRPLIQLEEEYCF